MYILNYVFCISIKLCFNSISCSLYFLQLSVEDVPTIVGALDSRTGLRIDWSGFEPWLGICARHLTLTVLVSTQARMQT